MFDEDIAGNGSEEQRQAFQSLQSHWQQRRQVGEAGSRPKPKPRKSAFAWLCALDNMLWQTSRRSLADFKPGEDGSVRDLPLLSVSADQGSDGNAAVYYLLHKLMQNVCWFPDHSHDYQRDVQNSWQSLQWGAWTKLMVVVMNLCHGPFGGGSRHKELQASTEKMFEVLGQGHHSLLALHSEAICDEIGDREAFGSADCDSKILSSWKDDVSRLYRGPKVAMCRFASFIDAAQDLARRWTFYKFRLLFLAFVNGQLRDKNILKIMRSNAAAAAQNQMPEGRASTAEKPNLRQTYSSNVTLSLCMLCDEDGRQRLRVLSAVSQPFRQWYGQQSKVLRSMDASERWFVHQLLKGGLLSPVRETLSLLKNADIMRYCGIGAPVARRVTSWEDERLQRERRWVSAVAEYTLVLCAERSRRQLWLSVGVLSMLVGLLSKSEEKVTKTLGDMQLLGKAAAVAEGKGSWWRDLIRRSWLKHTSTLQILGFLEEHGWKNSEAVSLFARLRLRAIGQSKLVEDMFQRSRKLEKDTNNKEVANRRIYHNLFAGGVASQVHHYKPPSWQSEVLEAGAGIEVPEAVYHPKIKQADVKLKGITSNSQDWFSPGPANLSRPWVESVMLEHAYRRNVWEAVASRHRYCILMRSCNLLVKHVGAASWKLSFGDVCALATILWPVDLVKTDGGQEFYVPASGDAATMSWAVVVEPKEWEAKVLTWQGPLERGFHRGHSHESSINGEVWGCTSAGVQVHVGGPEDSGNKRQGGGGSLLVTVPAQ